MNTLRQILIFFSLLITFNVVGQYCGTVTSTLTVTPTSTTQFTPTYSSGRRAISFTATAGCTYTFTTCGSSTQDTYLRLYAVGNGTIISQSDDFCGTQSQITWTATNNGTFIVLLTRYSCNTLTGSASIGYSVTCTPPYNPCTTIPTISDCGITTTTNMSGSGAGWSITSCGFSTPGQERIFQFTPTTTGTYQLNVSAISGGYIDFFWKVASGGCTNTGWNCIDDINTTGTYNAVSSMTFNAGTTYYILLDPETNGNYSTTFSLVCPIPPTHNPCATIPTITDCGVSTTISMTGNGAGWSPGSCGWTTPGQERIFQFTPTTTGTYQLNISSISGGYIDFFWKPASGGCTNTGWNCIDDINTIGTYAANTPMNLTAGTTYYILLDPETNGTYNTTFNIVCPPNGCINTFQYITVNAPSTNTPITLATNQWQDEFNEVNNVIAGNTYESSYSLGGFITIRFGTFSGSFVVSGNSPLTWTAPTSGTYYIHYNVDNSCNQATNNGTSILTCISCAGTPPANDLICNAISMNCNTSTNGTTIDATNTGAGENQTCGHIQTQPGVWYVIDGTGETMIASLCNTTTWDSKISVFSGPNCNTITCFSGNDDAIDCGGIEASDTFSTVIGTKYFMLIHGFNSNDNFTFNVSCRPDLLPIKWKSFNGETDNDINYLRWVTEMEENTDYFEVEKSENGIDFESISIINAANNSLTDKTYNYNDENPYIGQNYYRIKLTNLDGSIEYSNIIVLNVSKNDKFHIYPNPFDNTITYSYINDKEETLNVEIINLLGQTIYTKVESCTNKLIISLNDLTSGSYKIKIRHLERGYVIKEFIIKK